MDSPLTSVYEDRQDAPLVMSLIDLHWWRRNLSCNFPVVVDVTYGGGLFWRGKFFDSPGAVIGCDRDGSRALTVQSDYTHLPFSAQSIDVLAFDPPHIPDVGKQRPKYMADQYSVVWGQEAVPFTGFIEEAERCLRPGGIIIAKLSDQIQTGKKHWQLVDFINGCVATGMTPCDLVVKVRKQPGPQPWGVEKQRHSWQRHSFFVVVRKGGC
jgi:hypothetical protein